MSETWDGRTHEFHTNRDGSASLMPGSAASIKEGDRLLIKGYEGRDLTVQVTRIDGVTFTVEPVDD